jgi:hypothetical protein
MTGTLKSIVRNRLKPRKSKKYLKWFGQNKVKVGHAHHISESVFGMKLNDYFLVDKSAEEHNKIHYSTQTENDFISDYFEAQNNLLDYVEFLEANQR